MSTTIHTDLSTDEGLRQALRTINETDSWEQPIAQDLLAEIRHRAARNAAHVASATGVRLDRGLVDDVLLAAWMILRRHGQKVLTATRPWAYLMRSAQRQVLDEVRAQHLLTNDSSIRGRAREVLPRAIRSVGSAASDLATAFRHEPRNAAIGNTEALSSGIVPQIGRHHQRPLRMVNGQLTKPLS
jgi:hypothetical protein